MTTSADPQAETSDDGTTVDAIVLGALYDFAGFLTTREQVIPVGSTADAAPMAGLVQEFATMRGVSREQEPLLDRNGSAAPAWAEYVGTEIVMGQERDG